MTAMNLFGRLRHLGAVLILGSVLSGCGEVYSYRSPAPGDVPVASGAVAQRPSLGSLGSLFRRPPPPPTPEQVLTPQVLAGITTPYLLVTFETNGSFEPARNWGGFAIAGQNGDVVTWVEGTARTMSFTQAGVLRATRGFGRDVMTTDTRALDRVIAGGAAGQSQALRVHRLLNGENKIQAVGLVCRISNRGPATVRLLTGTFATRLIEEACLTGAGTEIINRFWLDQNNQIRQSEQWVSPELGRIRVQRLR
ncbi:YjbF family lipoprotein [Shimia ponticola]|uniref:YjbF family lipoprotein n=1 Tax=Shimia ponticola TaxID=2582893 RepID=UPI0011BF668E|nr:YjbF family lipoprotein [Shimia ponticola]